MTVMVSIFAGAIFCVAKANSLTRLRNTWDLADRNAQGKLERELVCCGFSEGTNIKECAIVNPKKFCGDAIHNAQYPIIIAQITVPFAGIALLFISYLISGHLRQKYRLINQNLDTERRERRTRFKATANPDLEENATSTTANQDKPTCSAASHKTTDLRSANTPSESFRHHPCKNTPFSLRHKH